MTHTPDNGGQDWKDATSYSRDERGRADPRAWEITLGGVRVHVTKGHLYNPGHWALNCREIGADAVTLCKDDAAPAFAQDLALAFVAAQLAKQADKMRKASDAMLAARVAA